MKNLSWKIFPLLGALIFSNPVNVNAQEPKAFASFSSGVYRDFSGVTQAKVKMGGGPYLFDKKAKLETSLSYGISMENAKKLESYQIDLVLHYLIPLKKDEVSFRIGAGITEMNFMESKLGTPANKINQSFAFGPLAAIGLDMNLDKNHSLYFELSNSYTPFRVNMGYDPGFGGVSVNAGISFNSLF